MMDSRHTEFLLQAVDTILKKMKKVSSKIHSAKDFGETQRHVQAMLILVEVLEEIEVLDRANTKKVLNSIATKLVGLSSSRYPHFLTERLLNLIRRMDRK